MAHVDDLHAFADQLFPRAGGLTPPSSVVNSWPAANYVNPETRGWTGAIVLIVVAAVTVAVFTLRMWARLIIAKNAGLDDLLMSLAMIPLIGLTISAVLGMNVYGFQWHAWDQTLSSYITTRQITLSIEVNYLVSTSLIKISILCFYRRITSGSISKTFVYCVWFMIATAICYCIIFVFVIVFSCTPVEGYWHLFDLYWRLTHELKCHNEAAEIVAAVVVSTAQDLLICGLPILLVWNLQIPRRQKAALVGIFALGLLTCVCGALRTYYAIYVYYYTYDITWYAYYGWLWTALEADLGVICASAPALKVFFRRYFNLNTYRSGKYGSSGDRKTPTFSKDKGNHSAAWSHGTGLSVSQGERDKISSSIPLNRIQVSTGTHITSEERDDVASQKSDRSTNKLTALPLAAASPTTTPASPQPAAWWSKTVHAPWARKAGSAANKSKQADVERDAAVNAFASTKISKTPVNR